MVSQLVPLVAIVFGISFVPSIIWIILNYRKRRRFMELHHAERMAAIERGMDIPPLPVELIDGSGRRPRRTSLLPGLVWFFVGLALLISMGTDGDVPSVAGLVPLGIGVAYLIYYFLEGRKIESQLLEHELRDRSPHARVGGPNPSL